MRHYVVATPNWSPHHHHAHELERRGLLRLHAYAGRRVRPGVDASRTAIHPLLAVLSAGFMKFLPKSQTLLREGARFALNPHFDRWACRHLREGDRLITSYGYANRSMRWIKEHGGLAILDAGNSHPDLFWEILAEEHRRWKIDLPPVSPTHYRGSQESSEMADWVVGLSTFVTNSFIERGLPAERTFVMPRPVDLDNFQPRDRPRDPDAPLTLISTSGAHVRKGTPYLFEALRLIRKAVPDVRMQLNQTIAPSMKPLIGRWADLPIEWFPKLGHDKLPAKFAAADIYVFPSLEDGLARAATEAMACGLPAILSCNTGASDLIEEGVNGSVVPIRDPGAIRDAVLEWWEKIRNGVTCDPAPARRALSMERFRESWDELLLRLGDRGHDDR